MFGEREIERGRGGWGRDMDGVEPVASTGGVGAAMSLAAATGMRRSAC
jgi:hypothetical protein